MSKDNKSPWDVIRDDDGFSNHLPQLDKKKIDKDDEDNTTEMDVIKMPVLMESNSLDIDDLSWLTDKSSKKTSDGKQSIDLNVLDGNLLDDWNDFLGEIDDSDNGKKSAPKFELDFDELDSGKISIPKLDLDTDDSESKKISAPKLDLDTDDSKSKKISTPKLGLDTDDSKSKKISAPKLGLGTDDSKSKKISTPKLGLDTDNSESKKISAPKLKLSTDDSEIKKISTPKLKLGTDDLDSGKKSATKAEPEKPSKPETSQTPSKPNTASQQTASSQTSPSASSDQSQSKQKISTLSSSGNPAIAKPRIPGTGAASVLPTLTPSKPKLLTNASTVLPSLNASKELPSKPKLQPITASPTSSATPEDTNNQPKPAVNTSPTSAGSTNEPSKSKLPASSSQAPIGLKPELSQSKPVAVDDTPSEQTNNAAKQSAEDSASASANPSLAQANTAVQSGEKANEIFVQSKSFETKHEGEQVPPGKSQPSPNASTAGRFQDEKNPIGIVSTGLLPSVDADKSFAFSLSDIAMMPAEEDLSDPNKQAASLPNAPRHKIDVMTTEPSEMSRGPMADASMPEQVGARATVNVSRAQQQCYLMERFFDVRRIQIANTLPDYTNLECGHDIDLLYQHLLNTAKSQHPEIVYLKTDCTFGKEAVLHQFVARCARTIPEFTPYAEIYPPDGSVFDLVTSLVSSRICVMPNDPENVKAELLYKGVESILENQERRWGLNILFVRYGLMRMLGKRAGTENLVGRNASDMLDLLETMITMDAARGPVLILLTCDQEDSFTTWRDILLKLHDLPTSNVMILLSGSCDISDLAIDDVIEVPLSPFTEQDKTGIFSQIFAPFNVSNELIQTIVHKCGNSLTHVRRLIRFLENTSTFVTIGQDGAEKSICAAIDAAPDSLASLNVAYFSSFSPNERRFLCAASMIGHRFYINDVGRVLLLDKLPGEVPGFRDLRDSWCAQVAELLERRGEIFKIFGEETHGFRYEIPESRLFREIFRQSDKSGARTIAGCYGRYLERYVANEERIAIAYQRAMMWPEASRYWFRIAQGYATTFYDCSAHELLRTCLEHIGPQHDETYPSLLRECIRLSRRLGKFEEVINDAETLYRLGYMIGDAECSVKAFIDSGDALCVMGMYENAREMLVYAVQLAEAQNNIKLISASYYSLAKAVFESGAKGSLVNALRYAEKSLDVRRRVSDIPGIATVQALCARIYMRRGEPARAKTAASEAYQALMATGHWYDTTDALIAITESKLALGENMTEDYLERGFAIVEKTGKLEDKFNLLCTRLRLTIPDPEKNYPIIRNDFIALSSIVRKHPMLTWITEYRLLIAMFDFSRKNFKKTTKSMRAFFEVAQKLGNTFLQTLGYALSAELNFEVYKRHVGTMSLDKTEKLYTSSTSHFESIGAWHHVATTLRDYANFLDFGQRTSEAEAVRIRADKVDPYKH